MEIHEFELDVEYYNEAFRNGNKIHMVRQLILLNYFHPEIGQIKLCNLDEKARKYYVNAVFPITKDMRARGIIGSPPNKLI